MQPFACARAGARMILALGSFSFHVNKAFKENYDYHKSFYNDSTVLDILAPVPRDFYIRVRPRLDFNRSLDSGICSSPPEERRLILRTAAGNRAQVLYETIRNELYEM